MKTHKYSDDCTCQQCTDIFNKVLFAVIEKSSVDKQAKNIRAAIDKAREEEDD